MSKITQEQRILKHLQEFGSITTLEAFKEYGASRLSAVIFELKKKGYQINCSTRLTKKNRYGDAVTFTI